MKKINIFNQKWNNKYIDNFIAFVIISFCILSIPCFCIYGICTEPLKEVLICEVNSCKVEKHFLMTNPYSYQIIRPHKISIRRNSSPRYFTSYSLINNDTNSKMFETDYFYNSFTVKKDRDLILSSNNTKIVKYNFALHLLLGYCISIIGVLICGRINYLNKQKLRK